ncbi:hypothetical protein ABPG72_014713 [Tetrahymena utriculariae]
MDSKKETNVPTEVDSELADYLIQGSGDVGVKFRTLYEAQRSIEYKKLDINLNVVGCGKKNGINLFSKDTNFPINRLFVDPDRFSYNKLGMIRANGFSELKGDGKKSQETSSSLVGGMSWSLWKAISRGNQGDVYQLGGAYVFDTTGKILYSFVDHSAEGHISVQQINELAQTYGKKASQ